MIPEKQLKKIFAKFANRKVEARVDPETRIIGGQSYDFSEVIIAPDDKATTELKTAVKDAGFDLHLWTPGSYGTLDFRADRVNASIYKARDGSFRISPDYKIG